MVFICIPMYPSFVVQALFVGNVRATDLLCLGEQAAKKLGASSVEDWLKVSNWESVLKLNRNCILNKCIPASNTVEGDVSADLNQRRQICFASI